MDHSMEPSSQPCGVVKINVGVVHSLPREPSQGARVLKLVILNGDCAFHNYFALSQRGWPNSPSLELHVPLSAPLSFPTP